MGPSSARSRSRSAPRTMQPTSSQAEAQQDPLSHEERAWPAGDSGENPELKAPLGVIHVVTDEEEQQPSAPENRPM